MIGEVLQTPITPMPDEDTINSVNLANHHYSYLVTRKFSDPAFSQEQEPDPEPEANPGPEQESEPRLSPYNDLIKPEYLPHIGQYYSCIEHPDVWDTNLRGLEESHFKPFHKEENLI
jgi:hypothetical protein